MIGRLCAIAALVLTTACAAQDDEEPTREELTAEVAALEQQLVDAGAKAEDLESAATQLQTATAVLGSDVDRFSSENWREVVPAVSSDAAAIDTAHQEIEAASEEMTQAVADR